MNSGLWNEETNTSEMTEGGIHGLTQTDESLPELEIENNSLPEIETEVSGSGTLSDIEVESAGPQTPSQDDNDDADDLLQGLVGGVALILAVIVLGEALKGLAGLLSGNSSPDIELDEVEKQILASN